MSLTHQKVSLIADSVVTGEVRPSDWNAAHVFNPALTGLIVDKLGNNSFEGIAATGILANPLGDNNYVGIATTIAGYFLQRKRNSVNPAYEFTAPYLKNCLQYQFSQTPAVALTSGIPIGVTLAPLPDGINSFSPNSHYILINGVEHLITGVAGSVVTFTPSSSIASGAWTITSATYGMQEAHYSELLKAAVTENFGGLLADGLRLPNGYYTTSKVFIKTRTGTDVSRFSFRGENMWHTELIPRTATQDIFVWADNFAADVGVRNSAHFSDCRFAKAAAATHQTAGSCIKITGHVRVHVENCSFLSIFNGVNAPAFSVSMNCSGLFGEGIVNNLIYISGNPPPGTAYASIFDLQYIYCDGRYTGGLLSPALIKIVGTIGGGIMTNLWMQASQINVALTSLTGRATNEIIISNSIFDQDNVGGVTANLVISNDDLNPESASNTVKVVGSYFNSWGYNILAQYYKSIDIKNNTFRNFGSNSAVALNTCNDCYVDYNSFNDLFRLQSYQILLSNSTAGYGTNLFIRGNSSMSSDLNAVGNNTPNFIGMGLVIGGTVVIKNNDCLNTDALILTSATPSRTTCWIKGNIVPDYVPAAITAAATIAIPFDDDSTITAINGTTPITKITGGQLGMRRNFVSGAALTFSTGGVSPGDVVTAKTIAINETFDLVYYAANAKMYVYKSA